MTEFQALAATLDADGRQLLHHRQLDAAHTPDEWLATLTPLTVLDTLADDKIRQHGSKQGRNWGFAVLFWFLALFGLIFFWPVGLVLLALGFVFMILALGAGGKKRAAKQYDVHDGVRLLIRPLVALLREDIGSNQLRLAFDLRELEAPDAVTWHGRRELPPWRKLDETYYDRRWIYAETTLADGSAITFTLWDRLRKRSGTKRGSSGKIKHKTKYAKWQGVEVVVSLPTELYQFADGSQPSTGKVGVKQGKKQTTIRVRRKAKTMNRNAVVSTEWVMDALAEGHRRSRAAAGGGS